MEKLVITQAAADRITTLIDETGEPNLKLRVFVSGGGCSGFQYGFTFDDQEAKDDDFSIIVDKITVLIDSMSYMYLAGASIDFVETIESSQFVINNPNATSKCGCGSSFSV